MIVAGIILLLLAYLVPWPIGLAFLATICLVLGWTCVVVGIVLLLLSLAGRPVGGRRYWF